MLYSVLCKCYFPFPIVIIYQMCIFIYETITWKVFISCVCLCTFVHLLAQKFMWMKRDDYICQPTAPNLVEQQQRNASSPNVNAAFNFISSTHLYLHYYNYSQLISSSIVVSNKSTYFTLLLLLFIISNIYSSQAIFSNWFFFLFFSLLHPFC